MAAHFNILAWRIPWTEEPAGYNSWDHKESDMTEVTWHAHMPTPLCIYTISSLSILLLMDILVSSKSWLL